MQFYWIHLILALLLLLLLSRFSCVQLCATPEMGEPGGLPSMGSHRVGHDWSDLVAATAFYTVPPLNNVFTRLPGHHTHLFLVNHFQSNFLAFPHLPKFQIWKISKQHLSLFFSLHSSNGWFRLFHGLKDHLWTDDSQISLLTQDLHIQMPT